jgi:hypothetical protein
MTAEVAHSLCVAALAHEVAMSRSIFAAKIQRPWWVRRRSLT